MTNRKPDQRLPFHIERELLDSVFGRESILHIGMATYTLAAFVNFQITKDWVFWIFPAFCALVLVYRLYIFRLYASQKHKIANHEDIEAWETHYIVGSGGATLGLGSMGGYSGFYYAHSLATTICLGVVLGTMLTVVGRNFGSIKNVRYMAIACCSPMMLGLVSRGILLREFYLFLTAALLVSVYATSMSLSKYLRSLLMRALLSARESDISSRRFNIALRSMPNGLVLIDGDGRVVVINAMAAEMLSISADYNGPIDGGLENVFEAPDVGRVMRELRLSSSERKRGHESQFQIETKSGRWIQCEFNALDSYDDVIIYEDVGGRPDGAAVLIMQDVTEKVRSQDALTEAACFDKLTGLANRMHWEAMADAAVASLPPQGLVAMCILDVDRFKLINDTLGHRIGDEVIAGVAQRLTSVGDSRMIAGRMGGDEYVVMFRGLERRSEVYELFDAVFSAISTTYVISGHNIDVRCSGGVIVREKSEFNRQADMSRADMALYKVKRNPNQAWMLFDEELEGEYQSTSRIKHDLKDAISQGTLQVVYQPIFDVSGGTMVSTEALCRWEHYEVGYISPTQFIAMAEEIGVIGKLTEYVLRTACRDCKEWGADVAVSVNLSALDLARDEIVGMIRSALHDFDLPPSRLCIEVTETVFVKDFAKTAATLRTLKAMGVKTSLDDFGTGYSSLSYLSQLPLNRVKIDRAFVVDVVEDPKAQRLFRGVVSLAKELEFEIIVEGVEGEEQLDYIRNVPGVDMIQGYIFSRVVTVDEMKAGYAARSAKSRGPGSNVLKLVESK
jgi:diguanylate cyclase (GGDEF)-like protein|nr:EAL domain-containing protein [Neorhizobium tomejilense]